MVRRAHLYGPHSQRWRRFQTVRLIVFAEAVFAPLTGTHSIEGSVTALSEMVTRDGYIARRVNFLDHRCAGIQRVRK